MTTCTLNKLTGTHRNTFVMANTSSGKWYTNALGGLGRENVLKGWHFTSLELLYTCHQTCT